jgi:hypothetical protein
MMGWSRGKLAAAGHVYYFSFTQLKILPAPKVNFIY